jgi:hypothetical protein
MGIGGSEEGNVDMAVFKYMTQREIVRKGEGELYGPNFRL